MECNKFSIPPWALSLVQLVGESLGDAFPGAAYQPIQVNCDFAASAHTDNQNHGPTYTCSLGAFEEGGLWVQDPDGASLLQLPVITGTCAWQSGSLVRG